MRSAVVLGPFAGGVPACIDSKCYADGDCAGGTVCQLLTGECAPPECRSHGECGPGQICEEHACVVGCNEELPCDDGLRCVNNRCRALDEECGCALLPDLCLDDVNAASATFGTKLCLPGEAPGGTMLFFGSVYCPHCTGAFSALLDIEAKLLLEGLSPRLVFVQIKTAPITSAVVSSNLPGVTVPVVQDVEGIDMWEAYQEDWYHASLLETHSCISDHFGPLSASSVAEKYGPTIAAAWRRSLTPACPEAD